MGPRGHTKTRDRDSGANRDADAVAAGIRPGSGGGDPFLGQLQQDSPSAFDRISSSPAALRCAINLGAYSRFLSEAVLKSPEALLQVANSGSFYRV